MEERLIEEGQRIIQKYNELAGKRFKYGNIESQSSNIHYAIEAYKNASDIYELFDYIKNWVSNPDQKDDPNGIENCLTGFISLKRTNSSNQKNNEKAAADTLDNAFALLSQVCAKVIEGDAVGNAVQNYMDQHYGPIERKLVIINGEGERKQIPGVVHEKFDEILAFVEEDEPVYLVGPAGSGKNEIVKQIACAIGLEFYFANAVTQEHILTGFTDGHGVYHETDFYKAFKNGGIFLLDELDASIPEVLIILNAAIANRYMNFPAPIGKVEAHPNFRVIAAGNTWGYGADAEYVGRNQLDAASLDRFAVVEMNYSEAIQKVVCPDDNIRNFLIKFRESAQKNGIHTIVSYRGMRRISKMSQRIGIRRAIETCLLKGLSKDDIHLILNSMNVDNDWKKELIKIESSMIA